MTVLQWLVGAARCRTAGGTKLLVGRRQPLPINGSMSLKSYRNGGGVSTCREAARERSMGSLAITPWTRKREEEEEKNSRLRALQLSSLPSTSLRSFSSTPGTERLAAIALGLGAVSMTALAGRYAVGAYNAWRRDAVEWEKQRQKEEEAAAARQSNEANSDEASSSTEQQQQQQSTSSGEASSERENFFAKFFGAGVGAKFYEGGFEDTMTRREAALILGVRESSTARRIKEAHRKLLILNHPDTGGSTYIAGKINEAKELLLKGKRDA